MEQVGRVVLIGESNLRNGVVISVRIWLTLVSSSSEESSESLEGWEGLLVEGCVVVATFGRHGKHGLLFGKFGTCLRASSHEAKSILKYSVVTV